MIVLAGWIVFLFVVLAIWPIRERRNLTKAAKIDDEAAMVSFCGAIIVILEEKNIQKNHMKLAGAFSTFGSRLNKLDEVMLKRILNPSLTRSRSNEFSPIAEQKEEVDWYKFLIIILQEGASKNPKSEQIRLLIAYICYHKLDKKWQAIYCLLSAKKMNPSLLQECSIQR